MRHLYSAIFVCFIFLGACTQENKNTFEDIKIKNALCQNITLQQMDMHYLLGNPSKLCIKIVYYSYLILLRVNLLPSII